MHTATQQPSTADKHSSRCKRWNRVLPCSSDGGRMHLIEYIHMYRHGYILTVCSLSVLLLLLIPSVPGLSLERAKDAYIERLECVGLFRRDVDGEEVVTEEERGDVFCVVGAQRVVDDGSCLPLCVGKYHSSYILHVYIRISPSSTSDHLPSTVSTQCRLSSACLQRTWSQLTAIRCHSTDE